MPGKNQDIQQKLQQLRQQYAEKLPARINALEQQWLSLNLNTPSAQYEDLIREFHSLAGSGTSFGFPLITTLAREIEQLLLEAKSPVKRNLEEMKNEINAKLAYLKQAVIEELA